MVISNIKTINIELTVEEAVNLYWDLKVKGRDLSGLYMTSLELRDSLENILKETLDGNSIRTQSTKDN